MNDTEIVRGYFDKFFSGRARHSEVREFLTDDFTFHGPLMSASGAEEYIAQLTAMGDEMELHAQVRELLGSEGKVAALVDFEGPAGPVTYSQWFTMRDGKFAGLEVVYDPRSFLSQSAPPGG